MVCKGGSPIILHPFVPSEFYILQIYYFEKKFKGKNLRITSKQFQLIASMLSIDVRNLNLYAGAPVLKVGLGIPWWLSMLRI